MPGKTKALEGATSIYHFPDVGNGIVDAPDFHVLPEVPFRFPFANVTPPATTALSVAKLLVGESETKSVVAMLLTVHVLPLPEGSVPTDAAVEVPMSGRWNPLGPDVPLYVF